MRLPEVVYQGNDDPFEGDRTIWLRSLPAGARVTNARVKVKPVARTGETASFEETFTFSAPGDGELSYSDWGVTKFPMTAGSFVEVDFHARRTLVSVIGSGGDSTLQVDMGGAFIGIADDGTFMASGKTAWSVDLSTNPVALPGLTVNKFRLNRTGTTGTLDVSKVVIRSVPANLIVRLGQLPAFWTRLGELVNEDISPDFSLLLNTFITEAQPQNGFYQIPFTIHSDTIARLRIELNIDFVIEQAVLPSHLSEVKLPYNFSTLPGVEDAVTTVALPRGAVPVNGKTGAQIRGEFPPTRVAMGEIGEEPTATFLALVSPQCSLAQAVRSAVEIQVTGIDIPLGNTQPGLAGIHVAIQSDADGKPFGEILASAEVRVEKPLPGQSTWGSATLQEAFRILPNVRYWLVLQSQIGQTYWKATANASGGPPLQCTRDGALSWRAATVTGGPANLAALFRLRHKPERFSIPVQLQIGKGPEAVRRRLDEYAPSGRIEFNFDFAEKLTEHLSKPGAASPCGSGELLINGDFDDPPPDDATRQILGDFIREGPAIIDGRVDLGRGVDLSVKRFITLSVNKGAPIRIDCAGANPARTSLDEIVTAINRKTVPAIAEKIRNFLRLSLPAGTIDLLSWQDNTVPAGWQGTSNHIQRTRVAGANLIIATLENTGTVPVVLAQRVPVAGGCNYLFRVFLNLKNRRPVGVIGLVSSSSAGSAIRAVSAAQRFSASRWEIRWLGADRQLLREDEGAVEPESTAAVEMRVIAPNGAVAAEIRLVLEEAGTLSLDKVSFAPTLETLNNATFGVWETENATGLAPIAWTIIGGLVERGNFGALLRGDAAVPEDTAISQTTPVTAGETYELKIRATPSLPPTPDLETQPLIGRARFELRWLNDAGPVGAPIGMPLDGRDFSGHAWRGIAPAGARRAEIKLIQPKNNVDLVVQSVSFRRIDFVRVPLLFLAETPGELTAANFRVTYDVVETETAPASAAARDASPVVSEPIDIEDECEEDHACEKGTPQGDDTDRSLKFAEVLPKSDFKRPVNLTEIGGIGKARAQRLTTTGINSIEKLAEAKPPAIAKVLGISSERAEEFIAAAKMLLS